MTGDYNHDLQKRVCELRLAGGGAVDGNFAGAQAVDHGGNLRLSVELALQLTQRALSLLENVFLLAAENFQRGNLCTRKHK